MKIKPNKNILTQNYVIEGQVIEKVKSHKHLSLTYDSIISFTDHCSDTLRNPLKTFNYLRIVCKIINAKVFLQLYKTYILPKI